MLRRLHAQKHQGKATEELREYRWQADRHRKKDSLPVLPTSGRHMYSPAVYPDTLTQR